MEGLGYEERSVAGGGLTYAQASSAPLTGFIFALPLFIVYHAGLWWLSTFAGLKWANAIDIAIAEGLGRLGMAGPLLSFILVVIVFLSMHAMSGKPWYWPKLTTWIGMIMESLVMALPVFVLSQLVGHLLTYLPLSAVDGIIDGDISWKASLILSCGAGVYEEFFFRILVMGLLALLFGKVMGIRSGTKYVLAVILQALLFAASHHLPGGPEQVTNIVEARAVLPVFTFRAVAGIYFAILYLERGFGVAAGAHAGYDLMVVLLEVLTPVDHMAG